MIYLCLVHCHRFLFSLALSARAAGITVNTGAWPTSRPSSSDTVLQHDFQRNGQTIPGDNGKTLDQRFQNYPVGLKDSPAVAEVSGRTQVN